MGRFIIVYVAKMRGRGDAGATFIPNLKIVLPLQHVFPSNTLNLELLKSNHYLMSDFVKGYSNFING